LRNTMQASLIRDEGLELRFLPMWKITDVVMGDAESDRWMESFLNLCHN